MDKPNDGETNQSDENSARKTSKTSNEMRFRIFDSRSAALFGKIALNYSLYAAPNCVYKNSRI